MDWGERLSYRVRSLPRHSRELWLLRLWPAVARAPGRPMAVPGHLHLVEGLFLYDQARRLGGGATVVEIGSFLGKSTAFIAAGLRRVPAATLHCVDTFTSQAMTPEDEGRRTLEEFKKNTEAYAGQRVVHQGLSADVARGWKGAIDMLWIDGDHSVEGCSTDLRSWLPYVKSGAIVAFHDYGSPCGVREAVEREFKPLERPGSSGLVQLIYYGRKA